MDSIIRDHEAAWSAAQVPRTCGWRLLPTRLHRAKSTDPPCGSRQSLNNRIHSYEKLYFQRAQDGSNGFLYCPPGHLPAQHQNRAPGTRLCAHGMGQRRRGQEGGPKQEGSLSSGRTLFFAAQVGPVWKEKNSGRGKGPRSSMEEYQPPCYPSLPWQHWASYLYWDFHRWLLIILSSFFQVPCARPPQPDVQKCRMLIAGSGSLPLRHEAVCPSGFPRHFHRPWAGLWSVFCLPSSLLFPVPLLLTFSEAFFPAQLL